MSNKRIDPAPFSADELTSLENAKTESEWNSLIETICARREGAYPIDYSSKVIGSGLLNRKLALW